MRYPLHPSSALHNFLHSEAKSTPGVIVDEFGVAVGENFVGVDEFGVAVVEKFLGVDEFGAAVVEKIP